MSVENGYHVIGHMILDYWAGQDTSMEATTSGEPLLRLVAKATRDIKLLVGLMDDQVKWNIEMMEALLKSGGGR